MSSTSGRSASARASGANRSRDEKAPAHEIPPLEWLVAAIGVLLLAAALWILIGQRSPEKADPPFFKVQVTSIDRGPDGWLVRFDAVNLGREVAAELTMRGTLQRDGSVVESAETVLEFVPGRSTRSAGLYFANDPRDGDLAIRAVGYRAP